MKPSTARFFLHLFGWKAVEGVVPEKKCIILGVPHTSILDFVISYLYYTSVGGRARIMIKKEFFKGPAGWLLVRLGAVPVDRSNASALVVSLIKHFDEVDTFHLCLAPEGTRKPVHRWKTGYHMIALKVGCPVYMGYFDWKKKIVGRGEKFELTGDARADTDRLQRLYEEKHYTARHPEKYVTK